MRKCSRLKIFPDISMNIDNLDVSGTEIEEVHASSVERMPRLQWFSVGCRNFKILTHIPCPRKYNTSRPNKLGMSFFFYWKKKIKKNLNLESCKYKLNLKHYF